MWSLAMMRVGAAGDFDCRADRGTCPALIIAGDPPAELAHFGPAPFRGYADPSLRSDPRSGTVWLSYSWVSTAVSPSVFGKPTVDIGVSVHLARSEDGGRSFRFARTIWNSDSELYEGREGYAGHEVSTISPAGAGWAALDLRYFNPRGHGNDFVPDSFHFEFITGPEPAALLNANEEKLGGPLTSPKWKPFVDLSRIAGRSCPVWTEPGLLEQSGTLFLLAQCKVPADPARGFLGLFARNGSGWRWVGQLAGAAEAAALGGNELTQADIVHGRSGGLELLVTPSIVSGQEERHLGCVLLPILSLEPPLLSRGPSGAPRVLARITSSDSEQNGPGACAYDPGSETGVLIVLRRLNRAKGIVFSIHATGLHP
jgi:hypothetical protein